VLGSVALLVDVDGLHDARGSREGLVAVDIVEAEGCFDGGVDIGVGTDGMVFDKVSQGRGLNDTGHGVKFGVIGGPGIVFAVSDDPSLSEGMDKVSILTGVGHRGHDIRSYYRFFHRVGQG